MVERMPRINDFVILGLLATAAGCAPVPKLGPQASLDDHPATATATTLAHGVVPWPQAGWWRIYGDPQLDSLIAEGLAGSPDVAAAVARIRIAEAAAEESRAATLPKLNGEAAVGISQQSKNLGIPPQFVPPGIQSTGRLDLTGSFDLDLWGKNRARLAAARSEAEAARVDSDQAALLLSTSIASAYADLARLYSERDVAVSAQQVRQSTLSLTSQRMRAGLGTQGDVAQAQSRASTAAADIQAIDEQIAITRNRLAALVGAGPDRGLPIARPILLQAEVALPASLPLELLGRRPDIVSARLRAEAASSRIKAARADFYPNINLTGLIGLQSLGIANLFSKNSLYLNAGPAVSLPIFDGGSIAARYRSARATYDLDVAQYQSAITTALREVADATQSVRAIDAQLADQRRAVTAAEQGKHVAELRYRAGLVNELEVLATDDQLLQLRRAVADLQARRLTTQVTLIRALGGGFVAAPVTPARGGQ